jgi:hypothetical protein
LLSSHDEVPWTEALLAERTTFRQKAIKEFSAERSFLAMSDEDWVRKYAAMDRRVTQKYEHLPKGEQIGKRPEAKPQEPKKS